MEKHPQWLNVLVNSPPGAGTKKMTASAFSAQNGIGGAMVRGDLAVMSFLEIGTWVDSSGKTGSLTLSNGKGERTLGLLEGRFVSLLSNREEESLDQVLAGSGLLNEAKIKLVRQECRRQDLALSKYLMEKRLIDRAALEDLLTRRLVTALTDILLWEGGAFVFTPDLPAETPALQTGLGIDDALAKAERLRQDALFEKISQDLLNGNFDIPPIPRTVHQIQQVMEEKSGSMHDVLKLITADQVLTSKVLKVVNSSFYSFVNPVASLQHAIVLIGLKPLIGIVTAHSLVETSGPCKKALGRVMNYSFKCAYVAKRIAGAVGEDEEVAFVCGLLHDIGKTVLYNMATGKDFTEESREKLVEAYHAQAGVILAAKWNLPEEVIDVIENHQDPTRLTSCPPTVEIVHVACRLVHDVENLTSLEDLGLRIDFSRLNLRQILDELDQVEAFIENIF